MTKKSRNERTKRWRCSLTLAPFLSNILTSEFFPVENSDEGEYVEDQQKKVSMRSQRSGRSRQNESSPEGFSVTFVWRNSLSVTLYEQRKIKRCETEWREWRTNSFCWFREFFSCENIFSEAFKWKMFAKSITISNWALWSHWDLE